VAGRQFNAAKQVTFALASTLTAVAKEAQAASVSDVEGTFTVRNNWVKPSNAMGVRVLPASKADLTAAVVTRADWLNLHEVGGSKTPSGRHLAIPTENVKRTKRDIVKRDQRPGALRGKRDVVLPLKGGGHGLFQRRPGSGKIIDPLVRRDTQGRFLKRRRETSRLVFMYRLTRRAHIRRQSTMVEPTTRVFEKRFDAVFDRKLREAFRTAR
jgi:hypothetical protein